MKYAILFLLLIITYAPISRVSSTECGGEITELDATLESPGHPQQGGSDSQYEPNLDCHWWYDGDEKTLVLFRMNSLVLEPGSNDDNLTCDHDYVRIKLERWGDQKYCDDYASENTYKGIGRFDIWFWTDETENFRGFRLGYRITLDFDPCSPQEDPCAYGECYMNEDTFRAACTCEPGYTSEVCDVEIDECESSPCQNGGTCKDLVNEFECRCSKEWDGVMCEEENEPCLPNPCQHNGNCTSDYVEYTYECTCQPGYKGDECEQETGCGNPGIPDLEEYRRFDFNTKLAYTCVDGYILEGDNKTECLTPESNTEATGDWSHPLPDCAVNITWLEPDLKRKADWRLTMIVLGAVSVVVLIAYTAWNQMKNPWNGEGKDHDRDDDEFSDTASYSDASSYTTS